MRIAVDARELLGQPRGVGRFLKGLVESWLESDDFGHTLVLLTPSGRPDPGYVRTDGCELVETGHGRIASGTWWEQVVLPRALRSVSAHVLLAPAYTAPVLSNVPAVVAIHDLSYETHPEWFAAREGLRRRLLTRLTARRARRIVTGSRFAARELERHYAIERGRLVLAPYGVSAEFHPREPAETAAVARAYGLEGVDSIIAVGTLLERRRPDTLLEAFARVASRHGRAQLVFVGQDRRHHGRSVEEEAARRGVAGRVRRIDHVAEEALPAVYSLARVVVYLSSYEGFGLPPLEALACGAPLVASAVPALTEQGHGDAILVDEGSVAAVAAALDERLAESNPRPARPAWLGRLTWAGTAEAVLAALEQAL